MSIIKGFFAICFCIFVAPFVAYAGIYAFFFTLGVLWGAR